MLEQITIARPYTLAAFEQARQENALQAWLEMLTLAANIVKDPTMTKLIDDPLIHRDRIAEVVLDVAGDRFSEKIRRFIQLIAANDRLLALPEIVALFEKRKAEIEKILDAKVISAHPISAVQERSLTQALEKRFGRTINMVVQLDQDLIGGAIVHVGDVVIDGSLRAGLTQMANELHH